MIRARAVVGLVITGLVATGVPASERARRIDGQSPAYQRSVTDAVAGIQSYWKQEFPDLYGDRYVPVPSERVIAAGPKVAIRLAVKARSSRTRTPRATPSTATATTSSRTTTCSCFPSSTRDFGAFSVALVLAHEWGHAIQDRAGNGERADHRQGAPGRLLRRWMDAGTERRHAVRSR